MHFSPIVTGDLNQYFNPNAFIVPAPGTYGTLGRDALYGPGLAEIDVALVKNTHLSERLPLELRGEAFNVANHANFGTPNLTVFRSAGSPLSCRSGFAERALRGRRNETVRFIQPRLRLRAGVALEDPVVHVPAACCTKRCVVQIHQPKGVLHVVLEIVQRLELLRSGGYPRPARRFEEHLISAIQQNRNLASHQHARPLDFGLACAVGKDGADAVLRNFDAAAGHRLGGKSCLL